MYVSVFGDERGNEVAIAGVKSNAKYVCSELGFSILATFFFCWGFFSWI